MSRSQLLYLTDIADAIKNIQLYIKNLTFEEFTDDQMRIDAVIRNFEIIGEAVKNLSDNIKTTYPKIDWKAVSGFRDVLIHGYFGIDMDILWDIIVHKVPELQDEITRIIAQECDKKKESS
ncbi:HepT-like ribonuclease domain-containing protein [Methanospirillum lacunae]|uniref:DUF86 domain-containing protein n=1 Tax=Methanospirillum lacunae TaxID=668570 RepID=A0A2V2N7Y3_9EURY|nr:DUF86 domain-containing protein [Methanospirillum lacunae]PWR71681.1 DUF86 domain-containing protein [Methanospirillum lacunae]